MPDDSKQPDGTLNRSAKSTWTILSTLVVVVLAGTLIYAVFGLDRFFEEEYVPPPPGPSTPGSYSADRINDVCAELDMQLYEDIIGVEPSPRSDELSCMLGFPSGEGAVSYHQMTVIPNVSESIEIANSTFERNKPTEYKDGNVSPVEGPWEAGIFDISKGREDLRLLVHDENITVEIVQIIRPHDAISEEDMLTLMTTYAEQALDAYRE